jgi:hypothetical protein
MTRKDTMILSILLQNDNIINKVYSIFEHLHAQLADKVQEMLQAHEHAQWSF